MGKRMFWWGLAGFLFTAAAGTLLHFAFDWSGGSRIAAAFSPVNESVWEHMKMLFFPVLAFSVVQFCFQGKYEPDFLAVRGLSALAGTALIPVLFYTYTGILGHRVLWADAAVFLLADALTFRMDGRLRRRDAFSALWLQFVGLGVLWGLAFLFVLWTFRPPVLPLFADPRTALHGLPPRQA